MSNPGSQYPPSPARPSEGPRKAVKGVAPESVVRTMGDIHHGTRRQHEWMSGGLPYCSECYSAWDDERGACPIALRAADAAFAASLEWAADQFEGGVGSLVPAAVPMRRWARGGR